MLPLSSEGDPEGNCDQFEIQQKSLFLNVQAIQSEFLTARYIARSEHLSDPSQPRPHFVPKKVSWNLIQWNLSAITTHFDFFGHQRARSDETHVPEENIP